MSDAPSVRKCSGCDMWYDLKLAACPSCEAAAPEQNAALIKAVHSTKVNEHLYGMMASANQERRLEQRLRSGSIDRPPSAFQR